MPAAKKIVNFLKWSSHLAFIGGKYFSECHLQARSQQIFKVNQRKVRDVDNGNQTFSIDLLYNKINRDLYCNFSFGMVMYEVMTRRLPFYHLPNQQPQQVTNVSMSGERPDLAMMGGAVQALRLESDYNLNFVEATRQCMERCWHRDPDQRPTTEQGGWRTVRLLLCMYILFPPCIH